MLGCIVITLRDWLRADAFTLAMSSGFFGFYAHAGFLSVLEEEGLLPARVCGSSAGALVAGLWAAGLSSARICDRLIALRREEFWDVGFGLGLLRGARFQSLIEAILPVRDFDACRVPLAVSAFDLRSRRTVVLRSGAVAPALRASCTVPFMFQPVRIDGRLHLDGGILDRPGLAGASRGERVLLHHLPRSPERDQASRLPDLRAWPQIQPVAIGGLPRVHPLRLARGRQAIARAADGLRAALGRPILTPGATARRGGLIDHDCLPPRSGQ